MITLPAAIGALNPGASNVVYVDTFDTDSTSLYTFTQDSGAPSASISGGVLTITTNSDTTQAVFTRNDSSIQNGYVEADVEFANDSGLVLRFQDNANYYLLGLNDDSGVNSSRNLQIYRKKSGSFTTLGAQVDIAWPRGTQKTIRFSASGSTLRAYVDGTEVLSVTDSEISSAGKIGVRGNYVAAGEQNKFNALRWS